MLLGNLLPDAEFQGAFIGIFKPHNVAWLFTLQRMPLKFTDG